MATQIQYQDPSMQFLQFLGSLGGNRQSTTQRTTSDPAAISGLQQLFNTQLGQITPEGASALINSIFQQGARQVPVLATQHGQAVGARTRNNSPLALANERLQTDLSGEAMRQILTAQAQAGVTGRSLADATRTTETTQTSKPTNQSLAMMAAPFLIGQIPNIRRLGSSIFGNNGSGGSDYLSTPSYTGDPSAANFVGPSMDVPPLNLDGIGDYGPSIDYASYGDAGGGFDLGGAADFDLGSFFDFGTGMDFGNLDYGQFFADGGLVTKGGSSERNVEEDERRQQYLRGRNDKSKAEDAPVKKETSSSSTAAGQKSIGVRLFDYLQGRSNKFANGGVVKKSLTAKPKGYADGGPVRGVSNTGSSTATQPTGNAAINSPVADDGGGVPSPSANPGLPDFSTEKLAEDVLTYFASTEDNNTGWSPRSNMIQGEDGRYYQGVFSGDNGAQGEAGRDAFAPQMTGIRQYGGEGDPTSGDWNSYQANRPYDLVFNPGDGSFQDFVFNSPRENDMGMILSGIATAAAMAMGASPAVAFARAIGTRTGTHALGNALDEDRPQGSQFGGTRGNPTRVSTNAGFASGGEIDGPGTGTSDSIPIRVSDGEYVIPADVVEILGVEFFDGLRDAFHTPVAQGAR